MAGSRLDFLSVVLIGSLLIHISLCLHRTLLRRKLSIASLACLKTAEVNIDDISKPVGVGVTGHCANAVGAVWLTKVSVILVAISWVNIEDCRLVKDILPLRLFWLWLRGRHERGLIRRVVFMSIGRFINTSILVIGASRNVAENKSINDLKIFCCKNKQVSICIQRRDVLTLGNRGNTLVGAGWREAGAVDDGTTDDIHHV